VITFDIKFKLCRHQSVAFRLPVTSLQQEYMIDEAVKTVG